MWTHVVSTECLLQCRLSKHFILIVLHLVVSGLFTIVHASLPGHACFCVVLNGMLLAVRRVLPGQLLERAFCSCTMLETLDAQHSEVPASAPDRLHACCPHMRVFLHTPAPQAEPSGGAFCDSPETSD